jgi:hypothetical protein
VGSKLQKERMGVRASSLWTRLAFYAWLGLLFITLATYAAGISGHILAVLAAPWISLKTQALVHTSIPVVLTVVKFVTVPLLVLLTPFAHHHPTFHSWEDWGKSKFRLLGGFFQAALAWARSLWACLTGSKRRH